MKKILMALVLVLALSSMALAADIKTSGKVWWSLDKVDDTDATYDNGYRLQFDGTLDANSGFQIRLENGTITDTVVADDPATVDVDETVANDVAVGALLKRANYWVNFANVGKLTVGKQMQDYSALDVHFTDSYLTKSFTGFTFAPVMPKNAAAVATYNPSSKDFGAQASYDFGVAKVYGGASKADADDDAAMAIGASAPIIKDQLSVYAEYDKKGDNEAADEKYVGAEFKLAGLDTYVEYAADAEKLSLDTYYTIKNVELNLTYTNDNKADSNDLYFGTTMYF